MIKEAINEIGKMATDAAGASNKVHLLQVTAEPKHVYFLVTKDGKVERKEAEAASRRHQVDSADAMVYYIREAPAANPVLWVAEDVMKFVLDDDTRRDVVTCPLTPHPQFSVVQGWATGDGKPLTQKQMVQLLRVAFDEAMTPEADVFLNWIRNLRKEGTNQAAQNVAVGRESFSRSATNQWLSDTGAFCPESFTLSVPVFTDPWCVSRRRLVKIMIEVEGTVEVSFRLSVPPATINWRVEEAQWMADQIRQRLGASMAGTATSDVNPCKVYNGRLRPSSRDDE